MWQERVKGFVELALRCALLAVMDTILGQRIPMSMLFVMYEESVYTNLLFYLVWCMLNACAFLMAFGLLFVRARYLVDSFGFIACASLLFLSFSVNEAFVQFYQIEPATLWKYYYVFFVLVTQFTLASVYSLLRIHSMSVRLGIFSFERFCQHWSFVYHLLFLLTPIYYCVGLSTSWLEWLPTLSVIGPIIELMTMSVLRIPDIALTVERYIQAIRVSLRHHGLQLFIETQWIRLRVPALLQTYWISRIIIEMLLLVLQEQTPVEMLEEADLKLKFYNLNVVDDKAQLTFEAQNTSQSSHIGNTTYATLGYIANTTQTVLLKGCDGVIPLLGMTTIVSRLTHYIGLFMALLVDSNSDEDKNMGTMCGILFFVLALQTGLTRLEPSRRLVRLYRNICLLSTAILHFVHSMVHPILMNISASRVPASKHARVLGMCLFLVAFPVCLLCYLWMEHTISPWLLAVTAFSIEVVIKVVISLLIYTLFMIDSHREVFWEKLDDYIYYIKATGNTIEFLFGIFLFCNGAWIMMFESGGMIRAVMMCIHAYFNIWMQAREGWKVFIQRRTAVQKINSLPQATPEQLEEHNDVCAICFQQLESARVTRCHHMFHSVCLRKWLYHQDRCPMCHEPIYNQSEEAVQNNNNDVVRGRAPPIPEPNPARRDPEPPHPHLD